MRTPVFEPQGSAGTLNPTAVEESSDPDTSKKDKVNDPGKEIVGCDACRALAAAGKPEGSDKEYCKIHHTKGTTSKTATKLSS